MNPFYEIKSSFFTLTENNISIEAKEKLTIGIIGNVYEKILLEKFSNANIKIYEDYIYSIEALKTKTSILYMMIKFQLISIL